jgi:hypothetical protein
MWFGSVGSTATAISLSGFQSWLYSLLLQLMSTAVAGLPALEQRNRSICSLENCPPGSLLPTPVPASFSSGAGPYLRATRSAAPNGRSLPDDGTLDASTSNAAPSTATTTRLIPVLLVAGRDGAAHLSKRSLPAWRFRRKRQVDLGCNAYGHLAFFVMDVARAPQRG